MQLTFSWPPSFWSTLYFSKGVIAIVVLRADLYTHCAQYANLREALAQHQEFIGPMNADELRRAIEEPARRNGWEFEPGLVDLLLRDVGADRPDQAEPGALPLVTRDLAIQSTDLSVIW